MNYHLPRVSRWESERLLSSIPSCHRCGISQAVGQYRSAAMVVTLMCTNITQEMAGEIFG